MAQAFQPLLVGWYVGRALESLAPPPSGALGSTVWSKVYICPPLMCFIMPPTLQVLLSPTGRCPQHPGGESTHLVVEARLCHWIRLSPPVACMGPRGKCLPPVGLAVHQRSRENTNMSLDFLCDPHMSWDRSGDDHLPTRSLIVHPFIVPTASFETSRRI